jgi:tricarballylate dehydrogenase
VTPNSANPVLDVIVVGGGNAALCAALTARHLVPRVVVLERAPELLRGGNSRHTRNIRHSHDGTDTVVTGVYHDEELWRDLVRVSGTDINESLARLMIARSRSCPGFMESHGVRWQPPLRGTLHLARTNRFFLGGGKALVNAYYHTAVSMGIDVHYDSRVVDLAFDGDICTGVIVETSAGHEVLRAKTVVIASGGFEANIDWLAQYWGEAARNFIIRGGPFNDGAVLRVLLDHGARPIGDPKGIHAVAVDARSPRYDGGIVTRIDSIPFGVVVNQSGQRFADEGEDLWPRRYASWGRLIAEQPGQLAFSIFDAKTRGKFIPGVYPPIAAETITDLARAMGLTSSALETTIRNFNSGATDDGDADFSRLDGRRTTGVSVPKSNWAQRIDTPPYYSYPLRPGITFTYLGVAIGQDARVARTDGGAFRNVFAAGEVMSGNVLTKGYLAGIGLTIGTVFGIIAGESAARAATV